MDKMLLGILAQGAPAFNAYRKANPRLLLDLTSIDLSGVNLSGANLCDADFGSANLNGANLRGANLVMADLHGAKLSGQVSGQSLTLPDMQRDPGLLTTTTIADVNLGQDIRPGIHGAQSYVAMGGSATSLHSVDLTGIDLSGADLRNANLSNANLSGADLSNASLRDADLTGVNLSLAKTSGIRR